jgi:DNA-binding response OmpR family regulator
MAVMDDIDAANTTPVSGNMSLADGKYISVSSSHAFEQAEEVLQHHSILVVEDDPALAALEAGVLTAHGYTVIIVDTGERAVAALHNTLPDLVILDLELTGPLNGWDVLQTLRKYAIIPVLLTTSSTTTVRKYIRSRGETRHTLDHLPKPYPMQTLLKRIERMLMIAS